MRPTRAEIDLAAIRYNVAQMRALCPESSLLAVVKANGYGHGAAAAAAAMVEAGASWLGVATTEEAAELREVGRDEPVLLLSEPHPTSVDDAVRLGLAVTAYTRGGIERISRAAARHGQQVQIHLKVDTGMRRVGAEPADAVELATAVQRAPGLELGGVWTHCAVADEPQNPFTAYQIDRFEDVLADLERAGLRPPIAHAANSAAAMIEPRSRMDLVRAGIALYGLAPSADLEGVLDLRPALRLVSEVAFVKDVPAGTPVSYGHAYSTGGPARLATVPIGYADGVPRRLSAAGGEVLVGGQRRRIAGTVTMDQIVIDCGPDAVTPGDEVVLIGSQAGEEVSAAEWARLAGTISYEIVCGISGRVPRVHV